MPRLCALSPAVRVLLTAAGAAVCLAQQAVPDHTARVIVQYGQLSALSDNGLRALFTGDSLKPQQIVVTGSDGYGQFQVADGSTFEVFANSRVMFREHVGSLQDILNVLIGHVKVYIQHLNGLPNYNQVSSPTAVISVRGTVFEVFVEDADGTTFVSVDEGVVAVRNQTAPGDTVDLRAGDSIRVIRNQPLQPRAIDRGSIFRGVLRAVEEAVYQVMQQPGGTGRLPGGVGSTVPTPTGNGDKGKGGTAPSAPGAPPSAPGPPN
jgi:ferric-dicitrate binding protein FerR (iron transport regulator)